MKRNEIIVHEHKKGVKAVKYNAHPTPYANPATPRNPVAKNANAAIGGGAAGAHKDAKKASQAVRGQKHKNAEMGEGQEIGKVTKVDPATKKATLTKPDGSSMEVDSTALKPTPDGKMQMDTPDPNEIKTGTSVVSTAEDAAEEDMLSPQKPTDSISPIHGEPNHNKLLLLKLKRLAGL